MAAVAILAEPAASPADGPGWVRGAVAATGAVAIGMAATGAVVTGTAAIGTAIGTAIITVTITLSSSATSAFRDGGAGAGAAVGAGGTLIMDIMVVIHTDTVMAMAIPVTDMAITGMETVMATATEMLLSTARLPGRE